MVSTELVGLAAAWAAERQFPFDTAMADEVLRLREIHDGLAPSLWPAGSVDHFVLRTCPAYASALPDPDTLGTTLSALWGFLRATGRMNSGSASPAELRKEARRALPHLQAAWEDPARHSQGRVLGDFGRSIGISLDGAETVEDLQARLEEVQAAWNNLPVEERRRLMPDPSPKGAVADRWTRSINAGFEMPEGDSPDDEDDGIVRGDPASSARQARASGFVQACLQLADWVDDGRPVTTAGLLRPAVARDAYRALELWPWERDYDRARFATRGHEPDETTDPEVDRLRAHAALHAWRSAGECLPLDRLWYACESAGLVSVGSTKARRTPDRPRSDEEWRNLALTLLVAQCMRLGAYQLEPLAGLLLISVVAGPTEMVPLGATRDWWTTRLPEALAGTVLAERWAERLDLVLFLIEDCGLLEWSTDEYRLTDLGRDFAIVYLSAEEEGMFDDDWPVN